MITIKVKQAASNSFPDGWATFNYEEPEREYAIEHWNFLQALPFQSEAVWLENGTVIEEVTL